MLHRKYLLLLDCVSLYSNKKFFRFDCETFDGTILLKDDTNYQIMSDSKSLNFLIDFYFLEIHKYSLRNKFIGTYIQGDRKPP